MQVSFQSRTAREFVSLQTVGGTGFGSLRHSEHLGGRIGRSFQAEDVPGSASYSVTADTSNTTVDWYDINGDGLPDHVRSRREGAQTYLDVQLNLGHSLGAMTSVAYPDWQVPVIPPPVLVIPDPGSPPPGGPTITQPGQLQQDFSVSGNLQGTYQRIGGGISLDTSRTVETLVDLNGDGRPDRLLFQPYNRPYIVMFNLGNGQWSPQTFWRATGWPGSVSPEDNALSSSIGLGGNVSGGPAIRAPILWLCIMASLAIHADAGISSGRIALQDMNGDGYVDQVLRRPTGEIYVRLNRTGRANLLSRVRGPLGGSFSLDYSRQGNFVSGSSEPVPAITAEQRGPDLTPVPVVMPSSQWALQSVTVDDGSGISPATGHVMTTTFDYFDSGFYDRSERENYGYSHVRTTREDTSYSDAYFHNQDYWKRGLVGLVEEHGASSVHPLIQSSAQEYTTLPVTAPVGTLVPGAWFPAQTRTTRTLYGATAGDVLVTAEARHFDHPATGSPEWVLTTIDDEGDTGTIQDDVSYALSYRTGGPTRCIRVIGIAASVAGGGSTLHLPSRTAAYDPTTCFLTSVSDVVTGGLAGPHSLTTTITPDAYGNVFRVDQANGYWIEYTRDGSLHQYVTATNDAFGLTSTAIWDYGLGAQLLIKDANYQKQSFGYDQFGRPTAVYAPGDPNTGIAADDATVTFEYSLPTLPTAAAPASATTHHRSLPLETPINTSTFMDGFGRVIQTARDATIDVGGVATASVTASGAVTYDRIGRAFTQGQPQSRAGATSAYSPVAMINATTQTYDDWGRVTATSFPDGTLTSTAHTIELAAFGNTAGVHKWMHVRSTDPIGRNHDTFSDAAGRTLRVTQHNQINSAPYAVPSANLTTFSTNYAYDPLGRLAMVRDAAGHETWVTYDSLGRRTAIESPDTGLTEYAFNTVGSLAKRVTPNLRAQAESIHYAYDRGRLTNVTYPPLLIDGNLIPQEPTVFTYGASAGPGNGAGRIVSRSDASGLTTFKYGSLGETVQTTQELLDPADPSLRIGPYETAYSHDRFGRMRSVTYPSGEQVLYRYDAGGALNRVDYDRTGESGTSGGTGSYVQSILYDRFGQRTEVTYGNSVVSRFTYNAATRRLNTLLTDQVAVSDGGPRSVTIQNLLYTYAANGNVTNMSNSAAGTGSAGPATVSQHYEYDALDQLRSGVGSYSVPTTAGNHVRHYTATFEYDELGRMTVNQHTEAAGIGIPVPTSDRALEYSYNSTSVHAPDFISDHGDSGQNTIYQWDANGNQTGSEIENEPPSRAMQWDHEDRLAQVTQYSGTGDEAITQFVYDAGGTRTHKISQQENTLTVYPNQFTSIRRAVGGGSSGPYYDLTTNHVYAGEERVASNVTASEGATPRPHQTFWYHGDHLTTTNWVTNGAGVITEHLEYFPYGDAWIEEAGVGSTGPGAPEAYRYTAKELDSETGLYYFGARYYDPRIALWASADPILASYLDGSPNAGVWYPANLGLYAYSLNSPVWLRDPDGRSARSVALAMWSATLAFPTGFARGTLPGPVPIQTTTEREYPRVAAVGQALGGLVGLANDAGAAGGAAAVEVGSGGTATIVVGAGAVVIGAAAAGHAANVGAAIGVLMSAGSGGPPSGGAPTGPAGGGGGPQELDPSQTPIYRGGRDMTARPIDYRVGRDGLEHRSV